MPKLIETVIAVELDGVLFAPAAGEASTLSAGELNKPLADLLRNLHKEGKSIVAWTTRNNAELHRCDQSELNRRVIDILHKNGLDFISLHRGGGKPIAGIYLDSRAMHASHKSDVRYVESTIRALLDQNLQNHPTAEAIALAVGKYDRNGKKEPKNAPPISPGNDKSQQEGAKTSEPVVNGGDNGGSESKPAENHGSGGSAGGKPDESKPDAKSGGDAKRGRGPDPS